MLKTVFSKTEKKIYKIALLTGGPSLERGISLNSARSVLDHLNSENIEIVPIYFDHKKTAYKISKAQLYSNTPSDFDFKLAKNSLPLSTKSLVKLLKSTDIVFPVIHGAFGEDGVIQAFLERNKIPFIGSPSMACKQVFDKFKANNLIREKGFFTLPSAVLKIYAKDHKKIITDFFKEYNVKRAIIKPATGGSSIGVFSVSNINEALEKADYIFLKRMDTRVVIEPFAEGVEFTVILLENHLGQGVALLPTEIEADYDKHQIFDFRKKYLPTRQVIYHCPPRFSNKIIEKIQIQAEQLFNVLSMRDFTRFDGWVFPDGNIWFSDFNPISGMEQNSFLFQQAARIGFSHHDILLYILKNACRRYSLDISFQSRSETFKFKRKSVAVLFGGSNSERQVSLMSGTNVWLKLRKSKIYEPKPYILDFNNNVWEVPYALILNHTVEEIINNAKHAEQDMKRLDFLREKVLYKLALKTCDATEPFFTPRKYTIEKFLKKYKFVFLGLHGGIGEDGTIQAILDKAKVKYNGPSSKVSKLCMDKFNTAKAINKLNIFGVQSANQKIFKINTIGNVELLWQKLLKELQAKTLIVKPRADGCSAGIVRLFNANDLIKYIKLIKSQASNITPNTFKNQKHIIEMPTDKVSELLFENFIETDIIKTKGSKLIYIRKTGFIEITVGMVEQNNKIHVMNPSITVAEGEVLTVEEKFQGGTGVNITPPPSSIIKPKILKIVKDRIGKVATGLDITGYSRIDAFINVSTGEMSVIEINTLPGLTPSTVIYHQALAEEKPMFPTEFLEQLIKNKGY